MSSLTLITVLTPTGRRQNVRCTPNHTILQLHTYHQILEEVCKKQDLKSEEYDLTHHNHRLDMSSTVRFSGLPNNALLEMAEVKNIRAESQVTLGLQLENGQRVMGSFNPSDSVYFVLTSLTPEQSDLSLNPVIIYTRREIFGEENLKSTTLRNLGLTGGRAILRLIHRTPEQLRIQANVSSVIPPKERPESPPHKIKRNENPSSMEQPKNASNIVQQILKKGPENIDEEMPMQSAIPSENLAKDDIGEPEPEPEIVPSPTSNRNINEEVVIIGERNAVVFRHGGNKLPVLEDLPDEFYELTLTEAKSLLRDLKKKTKELVDAPLMPSNMAKLEKDKKVLRDLNSYKKVIIRVQFPDQTVLQGAFKPLENVTAVLEFVKSHLENPQQEIYLFSAPPRRILEPDITLVEANCVPSILLHFGSKIENVDEKTFLKSDLQGKFSSLEAAQYVATNLR